MKTLKLLLALAFLLTTGVGTVFAAGTTIGYVSLLPPDPSGAPVAAQAIQQYKLMLPDLLDAQKAGTLLDFRPVFAGGFVKIKYPRDVDPAAVLGRPVHTNLQAAHQPAKVAETRLREGRGIATAWIVVDAYDGSCFRLDNPALASARIVGKLQDKTGRVLGVSDDVADSSGYLYDCFGGFYTQINPGYKVTFQAFNGATLLGTYSSVTPALTFTSVTKATSTWTGTATKGKEFSAWWTHPNLDAGDTYKYTRVDGTVPGTGKWKVDFGKSPFRGGDILTFQVYQNDTFSFSRSMEYNYIYCAVGNNYCYAYGLPGQPVMLTFKHRGIAYSYMGKFRMGGWYYQAFEDAAQLPIFLAKGDVISATGSSSLAIPKMSATFNPATNLVTGTAPANRYLRVQVYPYFSSSAKCNQWVRAGATGAFTADCTTAGIVIEPGTVINISLYSIDPKTGNEVYYRVFQPY